MTLPEGFTREELLACVDREIKMRERVYPRWTASGAMSAELAERELARMRAVRVVVQQLPVVSAAQTTLFGGRP